MMYSSNQFTWRWKPLVFSIALIFLLGLTLTACGNNSTSTGSPGAKPTVTATATHNTKTVTSGCPDKTIVTTAPPPAKVVLKTADNNAVISVSKGDTIEIDLPFGHLWEGPQGNSPNLLAPQTPTGYAFFSSQACVWRFVAAGTGTVHL